jgi:hypothetical protein
MISALWFNLQVENSAKGRSHVKSRFALFLLTLSIVFAPMVRAGQTPKARQASQASHHSKPTKAPKTPKAPKAQKAPKGAKVPKAPKPPKNQYSTRPGSTKVYSSKPHRNSQSTAPNSFASE